MFPFTPKPKSSSLDFLRSRVGACRRLAQCERGNVAIIFALAAIPMVLAVGTAVDLSRVYLVKQRLAYALDAAGLAAGAVTDPAVNLQTVANAFFTANYPSTALGTPTTPVLVSSSGQIDISGSAVVPTSFMKIVGIDQVTVTASARIIRETTGLELVMALDNTGSMDNDGKLEAMKSAATDMVNILFGDETSPTLLRIGLVPFSGSVNIGTGKVAFTTGTGAYDWGTTSWSGCVMARTYPADVQDTTVAVGGYWDPFYWDDNDSYNNWKVSGSYSITVGPPSTRGPNKYCPREITPLTNNKTTLMSEISAMWAAGYTHINLGAIWALRVISSAEPFTEGVAYGTAGWNKAIVILTDGDNTTSNSVYTAYGYRSSGLLGCTSQSCTETALDNRLTEICTAIKAQSITLYTITFGTDVSAASQTLMRNCATDSGKYYHAPDSATISRAFRAIGAELKKLHLSQ
ncbi:MAG: pilus assembly protein [Rhodospirillales bacterium]|nr:pilus assembly protein [Rhodospirillales bacterium]